MKGSCARTAGRRIPASLGAGHPWPATPRARALHASAPLPQRRSARIASRRSYAKNEESPRASWLVESEEREPLADALDTGERARAEIFKRTVVAWAGVCLRGRCRRRSGESRVRAVKVLARGRPEDASLRASERAIPGPLRRAQEHSRSPASIAPPTVFISPQPLEEAQPLQPRVEFPTHVNVIARGRLRARARHQLRPRHLRRHQRRVRGVSSRRGRTTWRRSWVRCDVGGLGLRV